MPDNHNERPGVTLYSPDGHLRNLRQIEGDLIRLAVAHYQGNVSEIARNLDIGRSTLYRKLDEFGIGRTAQLGVVASLLFNF